MARPNLAGLVFDMDGTLFDSRAVVPDAYIATIRGAGGPVYGREEVVEAYSMGPPRVLLSSLLGRPSTPRDLDEYHRRLATSAAEVRVYPEIPETLSALGERLPLAVFTGASREACTILLERSGLLPHFEALVGGDEVPRSKPDPDGILLACERLRVAAREAAYVGDAPYDLEAARRSGALAVAAGWGHLYRPGVPTDVLAERPGDLLRLLQGP
ncbi:MAG: HAD family hydrolase [Actinobacteria bacterium]|nr:HAD family hydrolase [Actinomycetota bacterium]